MTLGVLVLTGAIAGQAPAAPLVSPGSEVTAALADVKRLHPDAAQRTRYLSMLAIPPAERGEFVKVFAFWSNSLSREAELVKPRRVTDSLLAVLLDDYSWAPETWEKLGDIDPYFHVRLRITTGQTYRFFHRGGVYGRNALAVGWYEEPSTAKDATVSALAPWLPERPARELSLLTLSAAPIVRADWWLSTTAIQAGRKGVGYYDWLWLKSRKDFESLVGLDLEASKRVKREVAGIVSRSGVSQLPRQIFRYQSVTGGYWQTRDVLDDNADARNALRQLDGDFKHQAEEHYGFLPNGLFAYYLSDQDGKQQETAPDKLGRDSTSTSNDGRIHVGLSCVRCHAEGVKPIKEWARTVYTGDVQLASPDYQKLRRLRQLYLSDLAGKVERDGGEFAETVLKVNGLKLADNAKAFARAVANYAEADFGPAEVARQLGTTEAKLLDALRAQGQLDPILGGLLQKPPVPLRVEDMEQLYPLLAGYVRD